MPGNHTGGLRTAQTIKKKYGPDYYREIGRKGGKKLVPKGFAINRDLARKCGQVGGRLSKRGKVCKKEGE